MRMKGEVFFDEEGFEGAWFQRAIIGIVNILKNNCLMFYRIASL